MYKKILVLDFDGVIHSYTTGWEGPRIISDPPVPGALEFIVGALDCFGVAILSARSHQWGGRKAMRGWLVQQFIEAAGDDEDAIPEWLAPRVLRSPVNSPWNMTVVSVASQISREIQWPLFKPPAHWTIDDRASQFRGRWPRLSDVNDYKPWNK